MEPKIVHHVEFGVLDGLKRVQSFVSQYNFRLVGTRVTPTAKQWLVSSKAVRFLITEISSGGGAGIENDPYVHSWAFPTENHHSQPVRDSVYNVAWRVRDIEGWVNRLSKQDAQIIKPLQTVSDADGSVRVCMVKSCVGNMVHTLVDDSDYSGCFLPGFQTAKSEDYISLGKKDERSSAPILDFVDHVAIAIPYGTSASVISWYERCLGMKRFLVNREDNEHEGLVISGPQMGLKVKTLQYLQDASGTTSKGTEEEDEKDLAGATAMTFVVVEPMPGIGPNQLDTFLTNHEGPGVFHLALHTKDIIDTVSQLQAKGVKFNEVPYTYYTEVGRLKEMVTVGLDVDAVRNNKILIDLEREEVEVEGGDHGLNSQSERGTNGSTRRYQYLMQIFTQPLTEADTFYLEFIQRVGATGFGSANVTALWRSVQAYFKEKEAQESAQDKRNDD